jgi:hypothetical protein
MVFMAAFLLIPGADTLPLAASGHLERLRSIEVPAPAPRETRFDLRFGLASKFAEAKNRQSLFENHNPC